MNSLNIHHLHNDQRGFRIKGITTGVKWIFILLSSGVLFIQSLQAQVSPMDTVTVNAGNIVPADTVSPEPNSKYQDSLRYRRIKRTILHSTFVPGWGQINNRQAWKTPIVVAAVTIPAVLFFYNLNQYKALKEAYILKVDNDPTNDNQIPIEFQPLSANSIKFYRDQYRQNVDFSALVFILAWGLNVADAAVFAHLRDFDISDKLSMKLKPGLDFIGRGNVALVFTFKDANKSNRQIKF